MVGAVGEVVSMKQRKLWKIGEDGLCCYSSAIQTRPGPSSLLEKRSKTPTVFVVLLCRRLPPPPKLGEMAKVYRYRPSRKILIYYCSANALCDLHWCFEILTAKLRQAAEKLKYQ